MQQSRTDRQSDPWRTKDAQQGKHDHRSERRQQSLRFARLAPSSSRLHTQRPKHVSDVPDAHSGKILRHDLPRRGRRHFEPLGHLIAPGGHRRHWSGTVVSLCNPRKLSMPITTEKHVSPRQKRGKKCSAPSQVYGIDPYNIAGILLRVWLTRCITSAAS